MKKQNNALTPFTHTNKIYTRGSKFEGDSGYAQFIINKELSKNGHLIELVNHLQKYSLPNNLHFKVLQSFYSGTKRPGFKEFPWIWKTKQAHKDEIQVIAKHFNESLSHAEEYYEVMSLSREGKQFISWLMKSYGKENK